MRHGKQQRFLLEALRNNIPSISIFIILILQLLLKDLLQNNETQVLANAKHFIDPLWIPNDWFLNQDIGYRALFNWIIGPLTKIIPLHAVSITGRLITYLLFSILMQKLIKLFNINLILVVPLIFLFITHQSMASGEWMLGGLEAKSLAYPCVLGSLVCFFNKRYASMFLLVGLSASFHVLIGMYAFLCLGMAILFQFRALKNDFPRIVKSSFLVFLTGAPALMAVFTYVRETRGVDTNLAGYVYAVVRIPHHLFPGVWTGIWQIQFFLSIIFFLIILFRSSNQRYRFLAFYALCSMGFFITGLVIYYTHHYHLLKYYWFRFGDTMVPFIGFVLAASCLSDILRKNEITGPQSTATSKKTALMRKAVIISAFCLTLFAAAQSFRLFGLYLSVMTKSTPYYLWSMDSDLKNTLFWVRNFTPATSTVMTDPFIDEFYITAERAQFVAFKHVPQSDKYIIDWYHRLIALNNGVKPSKTGFNMKDELQRSYYTLGEKTISQLAKEYSIDYYLDKKGRTLPFKAVYSNKKYVLYSIK